MGESVGHTTLGDGGAWDGRDALDGTTVADTADGETNVEGGVEPVPQLETIRATTMATASRRMD